MYTEGNKAPLEESWSCPYITPWKLVPVSTTWHIMPYMNLTQPQKICVLGQMEEEILLNH